LDIPVENKMTDNEINSPDCNEENNRAARLEQKKGWVASLDLEKKHDLIFELEILLKGLDRFFNIENIPLANMEQAVNLNFIDEMEIVNKFVSRVVDLSGVLLEASRRGDYQFRTYVESRLLGDYERSRWQHLVLEQKTPEDSLLVLYKTFFNLQEMIKGLLALKKVPFSLFFNTGSLLTRQMISNYHFSPARPIEFSPERDKVDNKKIGSMIRMIGDANLQRQVSTIILSFNRLLQYTRFIKPKSDSLETLKSSLLFFALITSEAKYLMEYMEKNLPGILKNSKHQKTPEFLEICDSLSFQLQMELKKIQDSELLDLSKHQKLANVRTAVENSYGIMVNFFQQTIVMILKVFDPELTGEEIFPVFISRRIQSLKLREDLSVLQTLMDKFEEITETTDAGKSVDTYIQYLTFQKGWVRKMKIETIPLMRYQDLVEFEKYFKMIDNIDLEDLKITDILEKFIMESKFFKIFVETTLGAINNRMELQNVPLEQETVEKLLKDFINSYMP
jgi:hypothetical protein